MAKAHQILVIFSLFLTIGYCKKCTVGETEIEVPEDMDCSAFTPVKRPHNVVSELHADQINVGVVKPYFWDGFPFPPNSGFPPRFPGIGWPSRWFRPNRRRPRPPRPPTDDIEECPDEGVKFISHPTNCEKYILCVDGDEVAVLECPGNLHFSRDSRSCVHPFEAECEDFSFECDPDDPNMRFLPDVSDCNAYFVCFGGNQISMRCGAGQHWDFIGERCTTPNEANCPWEDGEELTNPSINFARNNMVLPPNFIPPSNGNGNQVTPARRCPATGVEQIPVPGNCEEFIICFNGQEFPRQCPPGLHFCE